MKMINRLFTDAPFMADGALAALLQTYHDFAMAEHPFLKDMRERAKPAMQMLSDGVAILPIRGVLARNPDPFEQLFGGVEDTSAVLSMVDGAAKNPNVKGMLLDFDSPGGFHTGGPEVADAIRFAGKPTVAFSAGQCCSLAYWMGSQAGQIVASKSAQIGSIGAYTTFLDVSRMLEAMGAKLEVFKNKEGAFKAAGLPGTALTDEQRGFLQNQVQSLFNDFRSQVRSARPHVAEDAMRGQSFTGAEAKRVGLVDRVGDMNFALSCLRDAMKKN
jgi:signal peptide peptidase SppA